jgi:23S rRNA (uracil1939-C5)-methyltransferase
MPYKIERLGLHGDGIAEGPVFAPRTLPGEVVDGAISGDRLEAIKIVTPSSDRVAAPCAHYKGCGGCALQHASDAFVAEWKQDVVRSALVAHGLEAPIRRVHTSPPMSRRRATFTGRRTKSGASVGFHAPGSNLIKEVPACQLVRPALLETLPALTEIVAKTGSRKGEMRLTVTETTNGVDLSITGGKPLDAATSGYLAKFDFARVSWDGDTVITKRKPVLSLGTSDVVPPPGAFLQATEEGQWALLASVEEAIGDPGPIVDLFAGCGTFALPLSKVAPVHAVEGDAEMLTALDESWRHSTGLRDVTTETRDLFRRPLLPDELNRFSAAVIDPPRAGAETQTTEICASGIERIAFVSCNPVTFARDAALLTKAGYRLVWLDVVDQFRWSSHAELVSLFER